MKNKQDCYIAFTDINNPPDPVGCRIEKKCAYKGRKNIFIIKLERVIKMYSDSFHFNEYEYFFLAPKYDDENPLFISSWPIEVYLMKLNKEPKLYYDKILDQNLQIEFWATIYKTKEEAVLRKNPSDEQSQ